MLPCFIVCSDGIGLEPKVPEYFEVIEHPITVSSLVEDLEAISAIGGAEGPGDKEIVDAFALAVRRMWEDCWSYNHEGTKVRGE